MLQRIVAAAIRAPSGDNCQPWLYRRKGNLLEIYHNEERAQHSLNRNGHASLLTLGCVLESLKIAATVENLKAYWKLPVKFAQSTSVWATVSFSPQELARDPLYDAIDTRCTDRRNYQGGTIQDPLFAPLMEDAKRYLPCRVILRQTYPQELLHYIALTETFIFRHQEPHRDFMRWVRFTKEEIEKTKDGMPTQSLGMNFIESRFFWLCKNWSIQKTLNRIGFLPVLVRRTKAQLSSSACLYCLTVPSTDPLNLVTAGQLAMRVWLSLNQAGYGVHPYTLGSLSQFDLAAGSASGMPDFWPKLFSDGRNLFRESFALGNEEIPVWLFRTGRSPQLPPEGRTLRLPAENFLSFE